MFIAKLLIAQANRLAQSTDRRTSSRRMQARPLDALAKRHGLCRKRHDLRRNLIRIWVALALMN
jgi:hypothetical protein